MNTMQTTKIAQRGSSTLRIIEEINRRNSVGFNGNEQQRPRSQKFLSVQMEWMKTKGMVILCIKTSLKILFKNERKRRNMAGGAPDIIMAENPFENKFTIWAENAVILKKLSNELNKIDGVSQKGFPQQGFSWAVVKNKRDGEFYLKSPFHSGGTTIFSGVILRKIGLILDDMQRKKARG